MKKETLRVMLLGAALSAMSLTGLTRAADDTAKPADTTPAAKPADPAPTPGRGGRGNFNPADYLKNYRDQFEGLNLTDDQMKKIDGFLDTATTEVTKAGTGQDGREATGAALRKLREDVQSVLTDTQKTALRAKRIGAMYDDLTKRYTADTLKLTDDQKTKITALISDAKTKALAAPAPDANAAGGPGGGRGGFAGFRELRTSIEAVLTPDQVKLLPQFGRGGRGPGGGAGGAGGPPAAPASGTTPAPAPAK
jgi:Spy/CpxP family protein refolding chaperone